MSANINQYLKLQQRLINEKSRIEARLTAINRVLGGEVSAVVSAPSARSKRGGARKFSAATKAKMAVAQKARWAKLKSNAVVATPPTNQPSAPAPKKKRRMSAAGRAAIIAATKARWAKIKAAKVVTDAKPLKASK
jgi:hypothetical protein